jgi:hypothetical protein
VLHGKYRVRGSRCRIKLPLVLNRKYATLIRLWKRANIYTRSRTSPSHKPHHQAFLNWVAFNRSFAPNIQDIEKRTCPLLDCETCFGSLEDMLGHVKECPRLSKGLYRCFESGREERIGRCESPLCLELQQCKDRIANSVNSLKRRLSPRGHGPRRQANIPLEMQSLSPEMYSDYDTPYPVGVAELSCEAAVPPPVYTPTYYGSGPHAPAELSSGYYSESIMQSTAPFKHSFAELDAGESSAEYSLSYLAQTQPEPVELGANGDLMYTTQHRGQYRYGISELSTDNAYGTQHQNSARQQQPDNGSLNYLNSQGSPGNSHQTVSSDSPLSEDRYGFNPLLDESYQNISSPVSDDLSDPEPQASNYDYPARYYIPSTVSGASTDDSVENSIFSRTSAYPSRDNSMSSSELGQTVADMALAQGYTYLDETNRTCSEPDEIESLSSPSTDICDEFHRPGGIWDTRYDNGVYLKDVRSVYPSYTTGMSPQEG